MTEKELKKLNRRELLELLITQTKRNEAMEKKLSQTGKALERRELEIKDAGSIAEAALRISGVFEAASEASKIYLENIRIMEAQTRERCEAAEKRAREEADQLLHTAKAEGERLIAEAKAEAEKINRSAAKNVPKAQKKKKKKK